MASHAELADLWRGVLSALRVRLKPGAKVSSELLAVARKFLKDNGQVNPPDERARKDIEALQRTYLKALVESLENPRRSPALLGEARQFLAWAGRSPDLGAGAAAKTAEELLTLDVPFRKH
jgi:hypothetical protein